MLGAIALLQLVVACSSKSDSGYSDPGPPNPCPEQVEASCGDQIATGQIPEEEREACKASALRECSTNYYLRGYEPLELGYCGAEPPSLVSLNQNVDIRLFRFTGLSDLNVIDQGRGLQRYWEPHQLWFWTNAPSELTSVNYVMVGSNKQIDTALRNEGIDPYGNLTIEEEARARKIVGEVVFAPLRSFMLSYAVPSEHFVNVVVASELVSPSIKSLLSLDGEMAGLGLSPTLLDAVAADDPSANLYELLGLPSDFTPTIFVGDTTIRRHLEVIDNPIAHEMGHAFGLTHRDLIGNLMGPGVDYGCRTELDDDQLASLKLPDVQGRVAAVRRLVEVPARVLAAIRAKPPGS